MIRVKVALIGARSQTVTLHAEGTFTDRWNGQNKERRKNFDYYEYREDAIQKSGKKIGEK